MGEEEEADADEFAAEFEKEFDQESEDERSDAPVDDAGTGVSQGQGESSEEDSDSEEGAAEPVSKYQKCLLEEEIVRVDHALIQAQQNVADAPNPFVAQRFNDEVGELMAKKQSLKAEL